MIKSTDAYKAAVTGDSRRVHIRAIIDISDPNKVITGAISSSKTKYSIDGQLYDEKKTLYKYATLEKDRWRLDGSYDIYGEGPDPQKENAYASLYVSGPDGFFEEPQYVELKFHGVSVLQACSIYFSDNPDDGLPEEFAVSIMEGGVERYRQEYKNNQKVLIQQLGFTVYNADGIRITATKTSKPCRRLRVTEIVVGIKEEWTEDQFSAFSLKQQGDISNVSLPYGTCSITLDNLNRRFEPRNKDGIFQSITERQSISVEMGVVLPDGSTEYKRMGDYYQKGDGWKTSDNEITIQWDLVDIVGMLADRIFDIKGATPPTTLSGWASMLVGQLGENFRSRYKVDPDYANKPVTVKRASDLVGLTCGEIIRYIAMASGTWARADNTTGFLTFEPFWNEGNKITLDNIEKYPNMCANRDISIMFFDLLDGNPPLAISGNSVSAADTVSVRNPFIHTKEEAIKAARFILSAYGGNQINLVGRGDMTSEIGDVDTIWLNESVATTARRTIQDFSLSNGVLKGVSSTLLQPDGVFTYEGREVVTSSGKWKAPPGKNRIRVILIGKGQDGTDGTDGGYFSDGEDGVDGIGARIWSGILNINDQQVFDVSIGQDTTFGEHSSAEGKTYPYGYTDVNSGSSYGRTGVASPAPGSGDGGRHGDKGLMAQGHEEEVTTWMGTHIAWIEDVPATPGGKGAKGATGSVVIYWEK